MPFSFGNPHVWHPTILRKHYFLTHLHNTCDFKQTKNTIELGGKISKNMDKFLTDNLHQLWLMEPQILDQFVSPQHVYVHRHICCRVKNWSTNCCPFCVKNGPFLAFENLLLSAKRRGFSKNDQAIVKNWSNFVAQHNWTSFKHNLGPAFNTTFSVLLFFWGGAETPICIVLSAKHAKFKETQKIKNKKHYVWAHLR